MPHRFVIPGRRSPRPGPRVAASLAILLVSAACVSVPPRPSPEGRDVIILLPDEQGKTGAIVVSAAGVDRRLDRPGQTVSVEPGKPPGPLSVTPLDEVRGGTVGAALAALPKPPLRFLLHFRNGSAELTPESSAKIPGMIREILGHAPVDISVVGHTDTVGNKPYNDALSLRRAKAVAAILVKKGVDPGILEIASHGKENPLVPTPDQVPEPRNRRVEVTVR